MLAAATRCPSRLRRPNAGRWLLAWLGAAPGGAAAVTDAGAVTSREFVWGYAIRREWPDGSHDLFGFASDARVAQRRLGRDQDYWRGGPVRPLAVYVVAASAADVDGHPVDGCRRTGCPNVPAHSRCPDSPDRGQR
ncbi:hypothetical protein GA0070562_5106 [Micromonospora tulbaghiae]|uniref:Uncharacterized protein n=1 Tax=Micromonospora tulbaghiae TaxID=479978 RepID=A0ABY0KQR3_9ACTN|nr:hypothetical protein GA0070562_5106 [Micromonospora tulbaghiae]